MKVRLISLFLVLGFSGCSSSNPTLPDSVSGTIKNQYNCSDITVDKAQELLKQGHAYLDPEKDGLACLPNLNNSTSARESIKSPVVVKSPLTVTSPSYLPNSKNNNPTHQYHCADLTDDKAQKLLEAGHHYLDLDGDGDACEPDSRRNYAPVSTFQGKCGSKRYCTQMNSCDEAKFYLEKCNLNKLDKDGDGTPCESLCS
ncbi:MAG: excalibur calcium-binding domain-containing protein [Acinetobacter sp.]